MLTQEHTPQQKGMEEDEMGWHGMEEDVRG